MSLNPRLVAIQGIGFSPIQIATQGLLDYISTGGTTHRPKSTNTLKLQRIKEGRATALHGVAHTYARPVQARGTSADPPILDRPGRSLALPCKSTTTVRALRARGGGGASLMRGTAHSRGNLADSAGAARLMCVGAHSRTAGNGATGNGGSRVGVLSAAAYSTHGVARGAGARNLSDAEVAAIVRVTIDKRR